MASFFLFLLGISINFFVISTTSKFGCLNHDGKFVDWWVIYKESSGRRYVYLDSTMDEPLGLHRDRSIASLSSPLSRTIASTGFPRQNNKTINLAWNDQPSGAEFSKQIGHAKVI